MKKGSAQFIFCESLPQNSKGYYCNYSLFPVSGTDLVFLDVRKKCHEDHDAFIELLKTWHDQVTEESLKRVNHWWISPSSRLLSWHPTTFEPLFFAHTLRALISELQIQDPVYVLNAPSILQNFLQDSSDGLSDFFTSLPLRIQFLLRFFRSSAVFLLRKLRFRKVHDPIESELLLFSQVLNRQNLISLKDHYYSDYFSSLSGPEKSKVSFLFLDPERDSSFRSSLKGQWGKVGLRVLFVDDFLSSLDIVKILFLNCLHVFQILRLSFFSVPFQGSHRLFSWYSDTVLLSNPVILAELEIFLSTQRLAKTSLIKRCLYPYEERSIEKALLLGFQELPTFGFVHAVMHPGHICFDRRRGLNPPRPSTILTTGAAPHAWFLKKGYPATNLLKIGSPRFLAKEKPMISQHLRVLVMISQPHELSVLAHLIQSSPSLFQNFEITVRKYPYSGLKEQNEGFERLKSFIPHLKDEGGSLEQQLEKNDVVLFSTSSGGIEAMSKGLIGIYVNLDRLFVLNPLLQLSDSKTIPQIQAGQALGDLLLELSEMNPQDRASFQRRQLELIKEIYDKPEFSKLLHL